MKKAILTLLLLPCLSWGATYYVSTAGDNTDGTTWAKAWTTIDSSNANVGAGDTCYFGSGVFRGQLQPVGGTFSDRTAYICSSGVFGCAEIRNADSLTGWEQHSGNVYYVVHSLTDSLSNYFMLAQGESLLVERTSYAAVDAEGEWYRGGGDTIVHEIDACTGGRLDKPQFDINNDNVIDDQDRINIGTDADPIWVGLSGRSYTGILHPPVILRMPAGKTEMKIFSSSAGVTEKLVEVEEKRGILFWRDER